MLHCNIYTNATVMPCLQGIGGAWADGKPIPEALTSGSDLCPVYQAPQLKSEQSCQTGIYCGSLPNHFGHFLLEGLARLWYAIENPNLPIIWASSASYTKWQKEILAILGVENESIFINSPCLVEKLYVPVPGYVLGKFFDKEYAKIIGRYDSCKPLKGKKTYISRTKLAVGGYINEHQIESFLAENGWNIVHPQELSIVDQCYEFSSSEVVLGIESSAFHSLILQRNIESKIFVLARMPDSDYRLIPSVKNIVYSKISIEKTATNNAKSNSSTYSFNSAKFKELLLTTKFFSKKLKPNDNLNSLISYYHDTTNISGDFSSTINTVPIFKTTYEILRSSKLGYKNINPNTILIDIEPEVASLNSSLKANIYRICANMFDIICKFDLAVEFSHKSSALHDSFGGEVMLFRLYKKQLQFDKAVHNIEKFVRKYQQNFEGQWELVNFYIELGQFHIAKSHILTQITNFPTISIFKNLYSLYSEKSENIQEAIDWARQGIEDNSYDFSCRTRLANMLRKKGDFDVTA